MSFAGPSADPEDAMVLRLVNAALPALVRAFDIGVKDALEVQAKSIPKIFPAEAEPVFVDDYWRVTLLVLASEGRLHRVVDSLAALPLDLHDDAKVARFLADTALISILYRSNQLMINIISMLIRKPRQPGVSLYIVLRTHFRLLAAFALAFVNNQIRSVDVPGNYSVKSRVLNVMTGGILAAFRLACWAPTDCQDACSDDSAGRRLISLLPNVMRLACDGDLDLATYIEVPDRHALSPERKQCCDITEFIAPLSIMYCIELPADFPARYVSISRAATPNRIANNTAARRARFQQYVKVHSMGPPAPTSQTYRMRGCLGCGRLGSSDDHNQKDRMFQACRACGWVVYCCRE